MPRAQTPLAKAKLTGAAAHDPQRFRNRSEPAQSAKPVGKPPAHLTKSAKVVWQEMAGSLAWLQEEDRHTLEVASAVLGQMRDSMRAGEPLTASMISAANTAIGKLGASPTDRGKVFSPPSDDEPDDPFAAVGKRAN